MKTTVKMCRDGTFTVDTPNRGEVATRWIARLQGKKMLQTVTVADTGHDEE